MRAPSRTRKRGPIASAILMAAVWIARSPHAQAQAADELASCEQAAAAAEAAYGLPPGILAAIGRVESGRRDPATGQLRSWPWTLNVNGAGSFLPDRASAVATVAELQARGSSSIDVGCFQINLAHHPHAFANLYDAFIPAVNADYAARFLLDLQRRTGDWVSAVMAYHSTTPALGQAYWTQVQASWRVPSFAASLPPIGVPQSGDVKVWTPSPPGTAPALLHLGAGNQSIPTVRYILSAAE